MRKRPRGKMTATNASTTSSLAGNLAIAETLISRMKGLLGKTSLPAGAGLWIKPCKGIHTFGMRFPIDVVFLDRNHAVVATREAIPPNRLTPIFAGAASVLELPPGTIEATGTKVGDRIAIS